MRLLTDHERTVLIEVGEPGEGPVPDEVFAWAIERGFGFWGPECWQVTEAGRAALARDDAARATVTRAVGEERKP